MARITSRKPVTRITVGDDGSAGVRKTMDTLAVEEPLEIRVGGTSLAITMRTPGHDFDLAAGFLVSEAVISTGDEFFAARYCAGATAEGLNTYNVLDVTLAPGVPAPDPSLERAFYTTSSCGLCGKASIDAVRTTSQHDVLHDPLVVDPALLATFPDRLREGQDVFEKTGGLHAAALFDGRWEGQRAGGDVRRRRQQAQGDADRAQASRHFANRNRHLAPAGIDPSGLRKSRRTPNVPLAPSMTRSTMETCAGKSSQESTSAVRSSRKVSARS